MQSSTLGVSRCRTSSLPRPELMCNPTTGGARTRGIRTPTTKHPQPMLTNLRTDTRQSYTYVNATLRLPQRTSVNVSPYFSEDSQRLANETYAPLCAYMARQLMGIAVLHVPHHLQPCANIYSQLL
eukprot:2478845-Pyramimonas_sp.AAC.1